MNKNTQNNTELTNAIKDATLLDAVIYQASRIREVSCEAIASVPELMAHIETLCEDQSADVVVADLIAEIALHRYQTELDAIRKEKDARASELRKVWELKLKSARNTF
jgi:hypothetical protein